MATSISATGSVKSGHFRGLRIIEDACQAAQVGLDVGGAALGAAGKRRPGVRQDDRVVVDADDPGFWRGLLGDLMNVSSGGQPGTDIEELADALLGDQVSDRLSRDAVRPVGILAQAFSAISRSAAN